MAVGQDRHRVTVDAPSASMPDPDGGYTDVWAPLDPPDWDCSERTATARDLERLAAGTVIAQAMHVLEGRYHAGITTKARVTFKGRTLNVVHVENVEERDITTRLLCAEVIE